VTQILIHEYICYRKKIIHLRLSKNGGKTVIRKYKIVLTSLGFLLVLAALLGILGKQVTIIDGEEAVHTFCFESTVAEVLDKKGIVLEDEDIVLPDPEGPLKDGLVITIKRAVPVSVTADGEVKLFKTAAETVAGALTGEGIEVGADDLVEPGLESPVRSGMEISIVRVTHEILSEEKEIPFETVIQYDNDMYKGMEKVLQEGQNGKLSEQIRVAYHDGQEISREKVKEEVLKEPSNRVVSRGTMDSIETSRGTVRFKKAITMSATAYDATFESTGKNPGHPQYGITRSGTKVRPGVVAVDPKVIPLGTKLYVKSLDKTPDYGFASAEDTGGAIKGNKIDLYFESPEDVRKYGRRNVLVYILE
jgi:uncharacterized protein YabE (DUF348 family)